MTTLAQRLNILLSRKGMTQADLAAGINVSRQAVSFWASGRSEPKGTNLVKLAEFFDVSQDWLKNGEPGKLTAEPVIDSEDIPADEADLYAYIPEYDLEFGCGDRDAPVWIEIKNAPKTPCSLDFFQRRGVTPEKCCITRARGDSMEPTLSSGDQVLIRRMVQGEPIIDGKIYAMSYGGSLRFKRLYQKANGDLVLHSDNPNYSEETIPADEANALVTIYGQALRHFGDL